MNKCCHCGEPVKGKIHAGCALFILGECNETERKKAVVDELKLYCEEVR